VTDVFVASKPFPNKEIWATALSVVVPTAAPAAAPCESGQSHPRPGYAGPEKARLHLGTRESIGAWPATDSGGLDHDGRRGCRRTAGNVP